MYTCSVSIFKVKPQYMCMSSLEFWTTHKGYHKVADKGLEKTEPIEPGTPGPTALHPL